MISTLAGLTELSIETDNPDGDSPHKPIPTEIHPGIEICESLLSEPEEDKLDGDDFIRVTNQSASFTPPISPPSRTPTPVRTTTPPKFQSPMILLNANAAVFRPIVKKTQYQKQNTKMPLINTTLFPPLVHCVPLFWYR